MALFTDAEVAAQQNAVESFLSTHGRRPTMPEVFDILGWDYQAFKNEFESASKDPDPLAWTWRDHKRK